jgi:hypothetical protein
MLIVIILIVVMLNVIMLNVIMLNVIMVNVVAPIFSPFPQKALKCKFLLLIERRQGTLYDDT